MLNEELIQEAIVIAQSEISPISDTRGAAAYKSFLLGQLIKAHFIELFPEFVGATLAVAQSGAVPGPDAVAQKRRL